MKMIKPVNSVEGQHNIKYLECIILHIMLKWRHSQNLYNESTIIGITVLLGHMKWLDITVSRKMVVASKILYRWIKFNQLLNMK